MVFRVYVEKKEGLRHEAEGLLSEIRDFLGIKSVSGLRVVNRYDVEGMSREGFESAVPTVFSEPQVDLVYRDMPGWTDKVFAVEYLPGQYDQRADSAAQCIQIMTQSERPEIRTAKLYFLFGDVSADDLERVKKYVINPVEAREAKLGETPATLKLSYEMPETVETLAGFCGIPDAEAADFIRKYGLAMDSDDLRFCRDYFKNEGRDPTLTELRLIDTYWSDHCRHTTFLTNIASVSFDDPDVEEEYGSYLKMREEVGDKKPVCLMDIATVGAKWLKRQGKLQKLDESEEINACTVKMRIEVDGREEDWLLLFKNETHNHPTEIEPFGGAATCIGGAIRDPLSGRSYVYAAMRVTGAADPTAPIEETIRGKLPQRKLVTGAQAGYSSYGNQIGLATGIVDEIYHPGYAAKHMEIGAVIAAAPAENVRRERPEKGDLVILLGGRTGRDGIGGATGSSKAHDSHSVETCGAEVQKGNAPEERKLQRLFRNPEATRLIKRCNDFGAGGVSVAVGELADGLRIELDRVPKKYEGLDGTELAISESQERMAVVVERKDAERFLALAGAENLEATVIAEVTDDMRLTMEWKGRRIVDISREFLNTNGAPKRTDIRASAPKGEKPRFTGGFAEKMRTLAGDLAFASRRGLSERFDSTIGAGTLLMPFGGKYQLTPIQAMAHRIPLVEGKTDAASFMSWGFDVELSEKSPFDGAYCAVCDSVSKLIATGAEFSDVYLTFQEYFPKPQTDPERWGLPLSALLGALKAQRELGIAAIGGKDSMSGSFEDLDVPPTLVSFAVTTGRDSDVISPEFKAAGHKVYLLSPEYDNRMRPRAESLLKLYEKLTALIRAGKVVSAWALGSGGAAEAVLKMCLGNGIGFTFADAEEAKLFERACGSFAVESRCDLDEKLLGVTEAEASIRLGGEKLALAELLSLYAGKLEGVYRTATADSGPAPEHSFTAAKRPVPAVKTASPRVLIPVFPGTNCEYDTARAFREAGAKPEIFVVKNLTAEAIAESAREFTKLIGESQIVFIPGGFSGGDEPDGSGKFITAFFRNGRVKDAVTELLEKRDGLMGGVCNGFQALIKLGLVPYGRIVEAESGSPTLTFNTIGRHQSRIVRTKVASNLSPWMLETRPGEIYSVPISHGEGRFIAPESLISELAARGQIMTQYVDPEGRATMEPDFNPNGSMHAIEGITSPDGRVFGKMGHSERVGGLYKNVAGNYEMGLFRSAVRYFE